MSPRSSRRVGRNDYTGQDSDKRRTDEAYVDGVSFRLLRERRWYIAIEISFRLHPRDGKA
jgi:hypothetical protein